MASPMLAHEGRTLNPREKGHFSLHISDRISSPTSSQGSFSSIKYNHKPSQATSTRNTTLTSSSADRYALKLADKNGNEPSGKNSDVFTFTGQKTQPKKSYVLLFDPSSQKATLEPLDSTYTFNLSTHNGSSSIAAQHEKIYPKRSREEQSRDKEEGEADPSEEGGKPVAENDDPDTNNPYDFRHFLSGTWNKGKNGRGDESEYGIASSPDYRSGTGSAMNTPQMPARKPASAQPKSKLSSQQPKKRKSPDPEPRKSTTKKAQPTPAIRLERKASTHPKSASAPKANATKKAAKAAPPPPSSKIKSAEIVHSSDEDSDMDAEGEADSSPPRPVQRSPSPPKRDYNDEDDDEDEDEYGGGGGLEIEVPDERPKPRGGGALRSLGLGQNIGLGGRPHLRSPSNGPMSLASAANSAENSPATFAQKPRFGKADNDGVIDFGNRGDDSEEDGGYDEDAEGEDDADVEIMELGPPAQQATAGASMNRKTSVGGVAPAAIEEDEDDPLLSAMMEGLAGDSSEESEEE